MPRSTLPIALALALAACSNPPSSNPPADASGETDGTPGGRTWRMAGKAEAYDPAGHRQRVLSLRPLGIAAGSDDLGLVEAIVLPIDLYGIPWDAFVEDDSPGELPAAWVDAIDDAELLAQQAGLPVALALSPLGEAFDGLAARASDDGTGSLVLDARWKPYCYNPSGPSEGDPTKWKGAYAHYARWAVRRFDPRWVYLAQRVNLLEAQCQDPALYQSILAMAAAAHEAVQDLRKPPTTVVTVDVEDLYGYPKLAGRCVLDTPEECLTKRESMLDGIVADRLGLESHPAIALPDLGALPADWLAAIADARADLPPLIAGTGLPAVSLETKQGTCIPLLQSSEALQLDWLDRAIAAAGARDMELLAWDSPVDLLDAAVVAPCTCQGDATVCDHLDQLGGRADAVRLRVVEGVVAHDGVTEREAALLWKQAIGVTP